MDQVITKQPGWLDPTGPDSHWNHDPAAVWTNPHAVQLHRHSRPLPGGFDDRRLATSPGDPAVMQSRRGVLRGACDLPAADPTVLKLIIVRAPDRGQLRGQITGTKTIRTVAYQSKKNRSARYGEGATEIARIKEEEVNTSIVQAIAQPMRIHALVEGSDRWWIHIPDFSNLLATGERVLIDAKREWSDFRKPDGVRQTFLGQLAADALGYRYEKIVLASMGDAVRRANVDEVQAYRFVPVPDHLIARAAAALATGSMSLGALSALLHPVNGRSMACALMVRRVIDIDLDAPLSPKSECVAVQPLPLGMPSLRQ